MTPHVRPPTPGANGCSICKTAMAGSQPSAAAGPICLSTGPAPDLTAHTIRAWLAWREELPELANRLDAALHAAARFLAERRRRSRRLGAPVVWQPACTRGNQLDLRHGQGAVGAQRAGANSPARRRSARNSREECPARNAAGRWCLEWLKGGEASIEETALALEALSGVTEADDDTQAKLVKARDRAADWLVSQVESGGWTEPSPIGFYFAKLWYYEKLYPMIATVDGLSSYRRLADKLE